MSDRDTGAREEKVYEMLWDCPFCGQKKNLGLTHRHCPSCGAKQDASRRYFPPDDEKVAVQDHEYVGVDKHCTYCGAYSSRAAKHCGGCGAPLAEADNAKLIQAPPPAPAVGQPAQPAKKSALPKVLAIGCVGVVVVGIGLVLLMVFWKRNATLRVAGHQWQREIVIERFGPVKESAWCDQLPAGVHAVSRHREQRSTKKVQDGQTCHTEKVDRGNGTYVEKKICKPKYKKTPVYDDKCDYMVNRWSSARTLKAAGDGVSPAPHWPEVSLARTGQCVGCEREGKRSEKYIVRFAMPGKKGTAECTFDNAAKWSAFKDGSRWKGNVSVVSGALSCDSLKPE